MARATSAAETYFEPADILSASSDRYRCVDGGTAINNPTIAAILEADALWPGEKDLPILSLGTGIRTEPIIVANGGLGGWATDIVPLFQDFADERTRPFGELGGAGPGAVRYRACVHSQRGPRPCLARQHRSVDHAGQPTCDSGERVMRSRCYSRRASARLAVGDSRYVDNLRNECMSILWGMSKTHR